MKDKKAYLEESNAHRHSLNLRGCPLRKAEENEKRGVGGGRRSCDGAKS